MNSNDIPAFIKFLNEHKNKPYYGECDIGHFLEPDYSCAVCEHLDAIPCQQNHDTLLEQHIKSAESMQKNDFPLDCDKL